MEERQLDPASSLKTVGHGSGKWDRTIVVGVKDRCTAIVLYRCIYCFVSVALFERGSPLFRMYAHNGRCA